MYYVYMLRCRDGSLYTGLAKHLCRRMREHVGRLPACARYTRSHPVQELAALWKTSTRADAARLEAFIKQLPRRRKLTLTAAPQSLAALTSGVLDDAYTPVTGVTLAACLSGAFKEE